MTVHIIVDHGSYCIHTGYGILGESILSWLMVVQGVERLNGQYGQ